MEKMKVYCLVKFDKSYDNRSYVVLACSKDESYLNEMSNTNIILLRDEYLKLFYNKKYEILDLLNEFVKLEFSKIFFETTGVNKSPYGIDSCYGHSCYFSYYFDDLRNLNLSDDKIFNIFDEVIRYDYNLLHTVYEFDLEDYLY